MSIQRWSIDDDNADYFEDETGDMVTYDDHLSQIAALREELEQQKRYVEINANSAHGKHKEGQAYKDERDALREELATTNERWSKCLEGAEKKCERQIKRNSKLVGQRNSMQLKRDEARQRLADAERRNVDQLAMLHMAKELLSTISLHRTMAPADWCDHFKNEVADRIEKLGAALNPKPEAASHDE